MGMLMGRINTFCVEVKSGIITIEDVVNAKRISLEEWQKQQKQRWGY